MKPHELTVKVKLDLDSADAHTIWEFLNSDGQWVRCIGGEGHAHAAADANGPGKYRRVVILTQRQEFDV